MDRFHISTDPEDLDFHLVHTFISNSYWAKGIPRETLRKAIANSLVFGLYKENKEQVGFARVMTDRATFAYLGDVFIVETYRGLGLSGRLIQAVVDHPELQGLRRFMLATRDAHGLYSRFGFKSIDDPSILMQIWTPSIYE